MSTPSSRRQFLRATAGLAAAAAGPAGLRFSVPFATSLAGIGALASRSAAAADTSGPYRALVCLFMNGGSDSHNWVVPIDPGGYADYAASRGGLAWPANQLQGIASTTQASGRSFGMPDALAPLRDWYEAGKAAVIANAGPLTRPLTKAEYQAGLGLPKNLYSHNDQASTWQSLSPEGAPSGWGGRMGDILMAANQYPVFTAVSATGNAVFLSGNAVTQYQVGLDGPIAVAALNGAAFNSSSLHTVLARTLARPGSNTLQSEYLRVIQRSTDTASRLQTALAATNVPAIPATITSGTATLNNDGLAKQLRIVARMISAGQALGMRRQVFMVSIGGFDTHADQMRDQPVSMARVANSVSYFLSTMKSLGLLDNVTLFTASDFGRTLTGNGSGSDHGWGSHHFVAGGAVKGRDIYGRFPITALNTADDVGSGRLLPGVSVTQYAATLGRWMGLSNADLQSVLPTLGNFSMSGLDFL